MSVAQEPPNRKEKIPSPTYVHPAFIVLGIMAIIACCYTGMQLAGGIALGILMSGGGGDIVLHSNANPDNTIIVHVVRDYPADPWDCSIRLDMTYGEETQKEVYRASDACDVEIRWLDQYKFEVVDIGSETTGVVLVLLDGRDFMKKP